MPALTDAQPDLDAVARALREKLADAVLAFDLYADTDSPARRSRARLGKHNAINAIEALRWLAGETR